MFLRFFAFSFIFFNFLYVFAHAENGWKTIPGEPAICEPSTVVGVLCPEKGTCVLIGDNEHENDLFLYRINKKDKTINKIGNISLKHLLPKGADGLEDIEAIAKLSQNRIIVFGSHSRNKKCKIRPSRRIFFEGSYKGGELFRAGKGAVEAGEGEISCDDILSRKIEASDPMRLKFCRVFNAREKWATESKKNEERCKQKPAFNIEGAVVVKDEDDEKRVWVGLRAPLVDGKAVMLRLTKKRDKFRFREIALVDLNNHGIRALERKGNTVWVVAGPEGKTLQEGDERRQHVLWKFSGDKLRHGGVVTPKKVQGKLHEYVEGLSISGKTGVMVIDGDKIKGDRKRCEVSGRYKVMEMK